MRGSIYHYKRKMSRLYTPFLIVGLNLWPHGLTDSLPLQQYDHRKVVQELIEMNHPDPRLVKAIIHVESKGNPKAVSHKGAIGLMQVMPASGMHYAGMEKHDLFEIDKNIQAGCIILKKYQEQEPTLRRALHRYSGGAKGYYEKVMAEMKKERSEG